MKQEDLKKIQKVQLTIMDDIHRVCVEYHIRYYMIGGTALGAIRHKGFIPWDVDIDIAMPRQDYERFVTECSKHLKPEFSCHDFRTDKQHFSPHAIVSLNNSYVVNEMTINNRGRVTCGGYGLYVDILPLDKVPNDPVLREKHKKQLKAIQKLLHLKHAFFVSKDNWVMHIIKRLISICIPVSIYWLNNKQQQIAQKYNEIPDKDASDICSTLSHYKYEKLCMPKSVWGTPTLYDYEGRQYYGQEFIREYLTLLFGNYMKLPSKKDQLELMNFIYYAEWPLAGQFKKVGDLEVNKLYIKS